MRGIITWYTENNKLVNGIYHMGGCALFSDTDAERFDTANDGDARCL